MTESRTPLLLVTLALISFAANSLLCRVALRAPAAIDSVTFTTVRVASGAIVLALLATFSGGRRGPRGTWAGATILFVYAIAFSVAYVRMTVGTGGLLLFAAVQLTMLAGAIARGERPTLLQWFGLLLAMCGIVILSWRGVSAPDPLSATLMAIAGSSWGIYSLTGRGTTSPLADTAGNFLRAVPFALIVSVIAFRDVHVSTRGLLLAAASGALASGVGYSIWYAALPRLTALRATIVQVATPAITAAGGIAFLGERATLRLLFATVTILSGIGLATLTRRRRL